MVRRQNHRNALRSGWLTWAVVLWLGGSAASALAAGRGVPYTVTIKGVSDRSLRRSLTDASLAYELRDRPPATVGQLRRRADGDLDHMLSLLRARGFYGAEVSVRIDAEQQPVELCFDVRFGPPYLFRAVRLEYVSDDPDARLPPPLPLRLQAGAPAVMTEVEAEEAALLAELKERGFPFVKAEARRVTMNDAAARVDLTFRFRPGPIARFGPVSVSGLAHLPEGLVRNRIEWQQGRTYNAKRLRDLEGDLLRMGMFASVHVRHAESLNPDGELPLTIEVRERKPRSIRIGANYRSDVGFGGRLAWQHRNLLGGGEQLDVSFEASEIEYVQQTVFTRHDFLAPRQRLVLDLRVAREETEAYLSRNAEGTATLARQMSRRFLAYAGSGGRYSKVEQLEVDQYSIVFVTGGIVYDTREDIMDPNQGLRLALDAAPSRDLLSDLRFLRLNGELRGYLPIRKFPRLLAAARLKLGTMVGEGRVDIPADIRYYAGGGGSVRGYEYQTIGDLIEGVPAGGISLLECSGEFRSQWTRTLGLVLFVDAGQVYGTSYPEPGTALQWGGGVGLRLFTPIGPIRLDVASPLNPREDIDDPFQFYVSIGQAF